MNIKPGAWVIINSGLALRHTDCGVTPQPQNTGISPACIVEALMYAEKNGQKYLVN